MVITGNFKSEIIYFARGREKGAILHTSQGYLATTRFRTTMHESLIWAKLTLEDMGFRELAEIEGD